MVKTHVLVIWGQATAYSLYFEVFPCLLPEIRTGPVYLSHQEINDHVDHSLKTLTGCAQTVPAEMLKSKGKMHQVSEM